MVFVTPVGVTVRRGPDITPQYEESYFLKKVIRNNPGKFKSLGFDSGLHDQIRDLYKRKHAQDTQDLVDVLLEPALTENAITSPERIDELLPRRPSNRLYKIDNTGLVIDNDDGTFHVIAKNKAEGEAISSWIVAEIKKIGDVTRDFNMILNSVLAGRDFGEKIIRQVENVGVAQHEPKNDFEKQVIENVGQITSAVLSNVEIKFEKPDESFEYDLLVPVASNLILDVEVKDHEIVREETHLSFENMKQKVISGPLDKARRISGVVMVVEKGFPKDKLSQLRELGNSRGVALLEENAYKGAIERFILQKIMRRGSLGRVSLRDRILQDRALRAQ